LATFELATTARILDVIRGAASTSRSDIARTIGLSRSAVAPHVERLLEHGLIREEGAAESTGGRRARAIAFNKDAGVIGSVDLGATSLDVALTNLAGEVLAHDGAEVDIADGPEMTLNHAREVLTALLRQIDISPDQMRAIGIGVPGPVELNSGRPIAPPIMPGWDGFPVPEFLRAGFGCPVYVDNDVNMMALGEQWAGLGQGCENFLFVKVGTGIGCGLVLNGRLYRGADGCAGDIGHIEVEGEPIVCRCGQVGCFEAIAAGPALVRMAKQSAAEGRSAVLTAHLAHSDLTARDVAGYAARGDRACVEIIEQSGRRVGRFLARVVNVFNPSLIIVGGGVSGSGDSWLAAIRQEIYLRSLPLGTRNLTIQRSQLGDRAGIIGAAALAVQQTLLDVGLSQGQTSGRI